MKIFSAISVLLAGLFMASGVFAAPSVTITTNLGNIVVELDDKNAPVTTANFLSYVDSGFYNGTVFHRVIPDFMIQGGGFTEDMKQKPTNPPIAYETSTLKNSRGTIAMARTQDLNSATSQFFINLENNSALDAGKYAVFGKVTQGMDVVDAIAVVPTGSNGGHQDVPEKAVIIESIKRN